MRFVLVHGGFQGQWAWDRVIPILHGLGHDAVAMELPGHGTRESEVATLEGYRDAVMALVEDGDILVGHSMGGHVITLVADVLHDQIKHLVYLAAGVPLEGQTASAAIAQDPADDSVFISEEVASRLSFDKGRNAMVIDTIEAARALMFNDCDESTIEWAFERLSPQQIAPLNAPISVPTFWTLDIPRSFIACTEDAALPAPVADRLSSRLNVKPLYIPGSHCPFLSRPNELVDALLRAVETKPQGLPSPL